MLYKLGPKKRFINFNDELVNNTLDESFKFLSTNSFSRAELSESTGDIRNIHYGDIHTKLPTICNVFEESLPYLDSNISEKNLNKLVYLCDGDIVIADASEDYKDIGKSVEVFGTNKVKCVAGLHTILARPIKPFAKGFWGQLLQTYNVRLQIMKYATGVSVLGISKSNIGKVIVCIPKRQEEQKKIADFLFAVDKKISQLKKKNALLHQYKKGVMQQLFCQKIRFKDDNGNTYPEWKMFRLKDVLRLQKNNLDMQDDVSYKLITVKRGFGGVVCRGDFYGRDILVKNYFVIGKNEFVISKRQIVHGACGLVPDALDGAVVSNEYNLFKPVIDELNIEFFNFLTRTPYMKRSFFINSDGVHIEKLLFKTDCWLKTKVFLPSIDEQKKIVNFLNVIDERILNSHAQIEQAQQFKKGLLQQMFV